MSIVVETDRAYVRSYEKAGKTRRLARDPRIVVAPSTSRGTVTGAGIEARAVGLEGPEARHAAHLLARKHPLLHGVVVPLTHRLARRKTGRTVHFALRPARSARPTAGPGSHPPVTDFID